jgi:Ca2+/H+ antiporter
VVLGATWGRDLALALAVVVALVLAGAVLAAVHHAEVVAHRVGEPFGSLVLAVAVTVIEVALIVTLMVSGGPETATLARHRLCGSDDQHALRHTAASLAIASGANVKVVQTMLGHQSATMTLDLYGHLLADPLDEVADAMDAARAAGAAARRAAGSIPALPGLLQAEGNGS